jgi:hypothetical protein
MIATAVVVLDGPSHSPMTVRGFLLLMKSSVVMRGLDPRIHHLGKIDGLPGQARQ